jgi:hypothetical protein
MKAWNKTNASALASTLADALITIQRSKSVSLYVINNLDADTLNKFKFYSAGCKSVIEAMRNLEVQNNICTECNFRWTIGRQKLICEICYALDVINYKALRKNRTNETMLATKEKNGTNVRTPEANAKFKVTCQIRFGGNSPMCSSKVKAKSQATSKANHNGVLHQKVDSVKLKSKATYLAKTGYEHSSQNPKVRNLTKNTNLKKYGNACSLHGKEQKLMSQAKWGVSNPMQLEATKLAARNTWITKHSGYDHPMKDPEFYKNFVARTLELLGVNHNSKLQYIKDRKVENCLLKHGVENISQVQKYKDQKIATSVKHFGVDNPMQNREIFLRANAKNKNIYDIDILNKKYKVQGSYEVKLLTLLTNRFGIDDVSSQFSIEYPKDACWSPDFYIHSKDMYVECKSTYYLYGVPEQLAKNRIKAQNLPNCIWYVLHNKLWLRLPKNWYLTLNVAMLIEELWYKKTGVVQPWMLSLINYVSNNAVDVKSSNNICIVNKLAIVMNSLYWSSNAEINSNHTLKIKQNLEDSGYRVVVMWEHMWRNNGKVTRKFLNNVLNINLTTVFARKCLIKHTKLDAKLCEFYNNNHIQGAPKHGTTYYLEYENNIVAAMTFSYLISTRGSVKTEGVYELVRYATSCKVTGGASKLLKAFISSLNPISITSYSDNQMFTGLMYKALNFTKIGESKPDYKVWFGKCLIKAKQSVSRKALSVTYIKDFNSSETEKENCKRLGIHRIYDCGKTKWELIL